jgi:hypothetical protein
MQSVRWKFYAPIGRLRAELFAIKRAELVTFGDDVKASTVMLGRNLQSKKHI